MNPLSHDQSICTFVQKAKRPQAQTDPTAPTETPADRPFNGFRIAASNQAKVVVAKVAHLLLNYEDYRAPRKRKRKPDDQKTFHRQVQALVCDLIHRELTCPGGWLAIPLSNAALGSLDRYKPPSISKTIKDVLNYMAAPEMDHIERRAGVWNRADKSLNIASTIRAGQSLRHLIADHDLTLNDFQTENTHESIVLKDTKEYHSDSGKWLQYNDTPQTNRYREDMGRINDALIDADIRCLPSEDTGEVFDTTDRYLRRYFNNRSFELGGRAFGGFWQAMSKRDRKGILIDGESAVTLDFGQMNPRILYGKAGQDLVLEDAYTVPGLEDYRAGVKLVFNALLHRTTRMTKKPKGSSKLLPKHMSIGTINYHVETAHRPIRDLLYKGVGMALFYDESQILIEVLMRLFDRGVIALPVHDAVIVARHHQELAKSIMLAVFIEKTGIEGIVNLEH
jgi:hypothetical protein